MAKSILFRTDANSTIGWGHFYRSLALAQMLAPQFNISFAVADPAPEIKNILKKNEFGLIVLPVLNYTSPDDRGVREFECDLTGLLNEIDIVVVDGYWFKGKFLDGLRNENVKIAVIEDNGRGTYNADLIINHAPGVTKAKYLTPHNCTFMLGADFTLLRPAFLQAARDRPLLKIDTDDILISFGGADEHGFGLKTAKQVLRFTKYSVHLIISPAHPDFGNVEKLSALNPDRIRTSANLSEEQMMDAMLQSRGAVVPASTLLLECIALGLPVISGFCMSNHKRIYLGFRKMNAFIDAGNFNLNSIKAALRQIEGFIPTRVIDGNSSHRYLSEFTRLAR